MIGFSLSYLDFSICSTYIWIAINVLEKRWLNLTSYFFLESETIFMTLFGISTFLEVP